MESARPSLTWGRIAQYTGLWQLTFRDASFDCPDHEIAVFVFAGDGEDRRLERAAALVLLETGRCVYGPCRRTYCVSAVRRLERRRWVGWNMGSSN